MCGRFTLKEIPPIAQRFGIQLLLGETLAPRFNVSPSQQIPVVVEEADGRALRWMQWGYRPAWLTPQPNRPPPINARAETLLERPMFRGAVAGSKAEGRCIIPADGFFEWAAVPGQRRKQPVYIRLKGGGLFGFAGLYAERPGPPGEGPLASCAIVTTAANELMAPIHQRMPVILRPEDEALWLDRSVRDPLAAMACLRAYPSELMEAFPVSSLVSSPANDEPALIEPLLPSSGSADVSPAREG